MKISTQNLNLEERIELLHTLGQQLLAGDDYLDAVIKRSSIRNPWFTIENQYQSVRAIAKYFLDGQLLRKWVSGYSFPQRQEPLTIGLVMAGNIPLVGMHDLIAVFISGNKAQVRLSDKDPYLLPCLFRMMNAIDPRTNDYFEIVENLKDFDRVIATGSNNTARYFEAYFAQHPHIIRKNRNSVAVLDGSESDEDLRALGKDVFAYFGLGCRNVSKLYLPEGYDPEHLLEVLHEHKELALHSKYKNNFDYNFALFSLNKKPFRNNGCLLLTEDASLQSRIAVLHTGHYPDVNALSKELKALESEIQCVVARPDLIPGWKTVSFGKSQEPQLWDYPDGVDTLRFLLN